MEKYLPTLWEIVGGTWKKEDELKGFKSEVAALERKIQLTLAPPPPELTNAQGVEQKQEATTSIKEEKPPVVIIHPKPPTAEAYKSFKIQQTKQANETSKENFTIEQVFLSISNRNVCIESEKTLILQRVKCMMSKDGLSRQ